MEKPTEGLASLTPTRTELTFEDMLLSMVQQLQPDISEEFSKLLCQRPAN